MHPITAAAMYVPISRPEFEVWLNSTAFKWSRDPRYAGIYLLSVGPNVAIKLSSTIGSKDDALGRGNASMQLSLVSKITDNVVNKKAQGQSHFARTQGWKTNWLRGIQAMEAAYKTAPEFYEVLATIADRRQYQADNLARIEAVPGWRDNRSLAYAHAKLDRGGVLMPNEMAAVDRAVRQPAPAPTPAPAQVADRAIQEMQVQSLRGLWVAAKRSGDDWVMTFAESIGKQLKAGRDLTAPQAKVLQKSLDKYRIEMDGNPASALFG